MEELKDLFKEFLTTKVLIDHLGFASLLICKLQPKDSIFSFLPWTFQITKGPNYLDILYHFQKRLLEQV
jgi:hypothetical protein